jgi:hypothetical protein
VRRAVATAVLTAVLGLTAPPASAAVTCTFATGTVTIEMSAASDGISIQRQDGGDNLEFSASGTPFTCSGGTPTVNNTDLVKVTDTTVGANTFVQIFTGFGPFAPGLTDEPGTSDEIEFGLSLGDGLTDQLQFYGTDAGADRWTLGADGVNLNPRETTGIDVDFTLDGVDSTDQITGSGNDVIDGGGGEGTGGPFGIRMGVLGADGRDRITGSTVNDFIDADGSSPFADVVNGGAGRDELSYRSAGSGVLVDLRRGIGGRGAGSDVVSNIEEVMGSDHADLLIGDAGPNQLRGLDGNDRLRPVGRGGAFQDGVVGNDGADTADYSNERRRVTVDLASSASGCDQTATGPSIAVDCLIEMERAIGGVRGDRLLGDGAANRLTGGPGNDELRGRDGPDVLQGKAGDDQLFGEAGSDRLDGGKHRDRCVGGPNPDTFTRCERRIQ